MIPIDDYARCAVHYRLRFRPSSIAALNLIIRSVGDSESARVHSSRLMEYIEDISDHISEGEYLSICNELKALCDTKVVFPPDNTDEIELLQESIQILENENDMLDYQYHELQERYTVLLERALREAQNRIAELRGIRDIISPPY